MTEILSTHNLCKHYGRIKAIEDLNIAVQKGEVYGVLGPNGSGKTTTLGIITGILQANKGTYKWFGKNHLPETNQKIGSLIETPNFYPYLTLCDNLRIAARIKKVNDTDINRVLGVTNLLTRKHSRFDTLSLGMKQRLSIASVLLGNPEVLVLDEPANGLDPEGIAEVRNIIRQEAEKGKTIIMASHILDEVEKVCSHVGILKSGRLIASGHVKELLTSDETIRVSAEQLNELYEQLVRSGITKSIDKIDNDLIIVLEEKYKISDLNAFAFDNGFVLTKMEVKKKSLEDHFLELVKK